MRRIMERISGCGLFFAVLALTNYAPGISADAIHKEVLYQRDLPTLLHNDFIRLAFHSSTKSGDTIYIDGGEINFNGSYGGTKAGTVTLNNTLALDLSQSWKTNDVQYQFIEKSASVPILNYGALWSTSDNASIFSFGGVRSSYPYPPLLSSVATWQYSGSQGWSSLTSQSPISPTLIGVRPAAAANTYGKDIGYMLGGFKGNDHAPFWPLPGLLAYNMSDNTWTNESTTSLTSFGILGGSLTYVPSFGQDGVLIAMGGEYTGPGPWIEIAANFVSFTNISIWDIASKTWYWQAATANGNPADVPASAMLFCSTGVASPDGTFEIFVYGGHNDTFVLSSDTPSEADRTAQENFNGVYVLSLPSFTWTRVSSTGAIPRTGHTCNLIGNRQMLSIGGLDPSLAADTARDTADPWSQGLGVFDMVDLMWKDSYDANALAYVTPSVVSAWYKSHNTSSVRWSSASVKALFTSTEPASNGTLQSLPAAPGAKSNVVIPVVISVLIITAILAILAIFLLRRHRKKQKKETESGSGSRTGCSDNLTTEIRNHLTEARQSYLSQRDAFIQHNNVGLRSPGIIFHPSELTPDISQSQSNTSGIYPSPATNPQRTVRQNLPALVTSNQLRSPTTATTRLHMDEGIPRFSESSAQTAVASSPLPSSPTRVWDPRTPSRPTWIDKKPGSEMSRKSESSTRSEWPVVSANTTPASTPHRPGTSIPDVDQRDWALYGRSRPHELE